MLNHCVWLTVIALRTDGTETDGQTDRQTKLDTQFTAYAVHKHEFVKSTNMSI
jgi:hypothetical protein